MNLFAYTFICCLLTLAVFIYYGPVTNPTHVLILEYFLKAISLVLFYFGVYKNVFVILLIVLVSHICWFFKDFYLKSFFKPTPRTLLTQDEFNKEAVEFTKIELMKLQKFCKNPEILYKLQHKLRDSLR